MQEWLWGRSCEATKDVVDDKPGFGERRRTARVRLSISILVEWKDSSGESNSVLTRTELVAGDGGSVILPQELAPGTIVTISTRSGQAYARIVGKVGAADRAHVYGVAFLGGYCRKFWGVNFPDNADADSPSVLMECTTCSRQGDVQLPFVNGMVYDANQLFPKICDHCNSITLWRSAQLLSDPEFMTERVTLADELSHLAQVAPKLRNVNERRHPRISMRNALACIQRSGEDDDVVEVHDLSRGGVRFSSRVNYQVGTSVSIAVPFTKGASNIFVEGRVVRIHTKPCGGWPGEFAVQFSRH